MTVRRGYRTWKIIYLCVFGVQAPSIAWSEQRDSVTYEPPTIEEIIVTATRRNSSLHETSGSIAALSRSTISDSGVRDIFDYWRNVPSLAVTDRGFSGSRVTIRGITGSSGNEGGEPTTAHYLDDTLLVVPQALFVKPPNFRLVDIERVEVLRGPQGSLFGSGSMGGAVRTITVLPDPSSYSGSVEGLVSATSHGSVNFGGSGVINVPFAADKNALRLVAYRFAESGFIDDVGIGGSNVNGHSTTGFRVAGLFQITEHLSVLGRVASEDEEADSFAYVDPVGKPGLGFSVSGDYQVALSTDDFRYENDDLASLTFRLSTDIGEVTYISSWVDSQTDLALDFAGEIEFFFGQPLAASTEFRYSQESESHEIRIASGEGGIFNWVAGAFFADMKMQSTLSTLAPGINAICGDCTGDPDGEESLGLFIGNDARKEKGLFADVTATLSEKWHASIGARWYDLERDFVQVGSGFIANPMDPDEVSTINQSFRNTGVTGRASIEYQYRDGVLFYGSVSGGFRPGGVNDLGAVSACNVPETFGSDTLQSYETGVKSRFWSERVALNVALFRVRWSDAQILLQPPCIFTVAVQSGGVTVDGLELESTILLGDRWTLGAGLGLNDATLDNDIPSVMATKGRQLAFVPKVSGNVEATYWQPLRRIGHAFARFEGQYVGSMYNEITEFAAVPLTKQPSYTLVNLKFGIESESWQATFFADNVLDKKAIQRCCRVDGEHTINRPRTIGLKLKFTFH